MKRLIAIAFLVAWPGSMALSTAAGATEVKVMTRNLYLGASLDAALDAESIFQIPAIAAATWAAVRQANFPERARALLRNGAELHVGAIERAREIGGEVSALLLRAARWSEGSHDLFPAPARAQAVAVLRLGYLLASARYATEAVALVDVWRHIVLPHAITRE